MDNLNYIFGYSCTYQCVCKAFSSQGCLWGGFKKDCVAGDNGREDGVYGDEIWVAGTMSSDVTAISSGCTYFQGAMIRTTPNGVRFMYLRKPGLSVSFNGTSASA